MRRTSTPVVGIGLGVLLLAGILAFTLLPGLSAPVELRPASESQTQSGSEPEDAADNEAEDKGRGVPGWARDDHGRPAEKGPPPGQAKKGGEAKPHHGAAMRQWAHCARDARRDGAAQEEACGTRPTPPGHAKRGG